MTLRRLIPESDLNLIVTGYTGPNQPAIARRVAAELGRASHYLDVDMAVEERAGMSRAELQTRFGGSRVKTIENEIVQEALLYRSAVIRVSGQTLMHSSNYDRFHATGPVVCLVTTLDSVLQRLHLALGARYHDPNERDLAVGHLRLEWAVRTKPGLHEIDTTNRTEEEIIAAVLDLWQQSVL